MSSTDGFYGCEKVEKCSGLRFIRILKNNAFTAVKRDAKF